MPKGTVVVIFGSYKASGVTFKSSGPADDIRLVSTQISFLTPVPVNTEVPHVFVCE
jgi:hypothetical protein